MFDPTLAGLIIYSPEPERIADFLREHASIPLAPHRHGRLPEHLEAFRGIHFAVWKGGAPRVVPSFRVPDLSAAVARAQASGARLVHDPIELGEGKRLAALTAGEVEIRFIQIA
jgi:hypothetical protein